LFGCGFLDGCFGRKRDRYDIIAEILEAASGGTVKTRLLCKAKLSSGQLAEYVALLVEKGLLESSEVVEHRRFRRVLKTTDEGVRFLESLRSLDMLWLSDEGFRMPYFQNSGKLFTCDSSRQ